MKRPPVVVVFAALVMSLAAVPVAADTTIQVDQTLDAVMLAEDPCNPPETVVLTGTIHNVGPVTQDDEGTVTMTYHLNSHFDGVGLTTGHKYVLNEEQNTRTTFVADVPDRIWMTSSYKLVNQTTAENFELIIVFRETVPGQPVIKEADSFCRG